MSATQAPATNAQHLLEQMCAMGRAAEIHYWHRNEPRTARTQLIELRQDCIYIAKPQCIGADVVIRGDSPITIYIPLRKEIYAFRSRMLKPAVSLDLNEQKRIIGAAIERPSTLELQQRRHDYRVSLAVYEIAVSLHQLAGEDYTEAPINACRFGGRLTNVSSSGFAVLIPKCRCPRLRLWDPFVASFRLPGHDTPLLLPVQLRHARRVHGGESISIGLRVIDQDGRFVRKQLQTINRFISSEQRRQLQNGKI